MKKAIALILTAMLLLSACAFAETDEAGRMIAPYYFNMAEGDQLYYENLIFNQDVIISGDNGQIIFVNCQFNGNVVNTAEVFTRVFMLGCEVNGTCILSNGVEEATFEAAFPKFLLDAPAEVVTEGTFGAVIALGDFEVAFNGETYSIADAEVFLDVNHPEAGFVPYEGQEANTLCVCQWPENGEVKTLVECEFDPSM